MKNIILAAVVAVISSGAVADQFDAANGELTNALQDRATNFNDGTNQRVNRAYTRTKEAAIEASGQNISTALAASSTPTNPVEDTDRIHDQITSTVERQGEVRQYQSGYMSSVSKVAEEANKPAGVSSEVVNNKDSLNAPLNTQTTVNADIANPTQAKNTPVANTVSATVDVANTPAIKNTPINTAALDVDRTPEQVASNALRQGEVRQSKDTYTSTVNKAPEATNIPTGVSSEVVNNKDSLNTPLNTQTNISTDIANPTQENNTPVANTVSATVDVANTPATKNTPIDTTPHAAIDVDRTPQQVASNALRQGEVRQSKDTYTSTVNKAPEEANTPAGVSSEVVHNQDSVSAPASFASHASTDVAISSQTMNKPEAETMSVSGPIQSTPVAHTNTPAITGGSYRAAVNEMQNDTINISAYSLSPDIKVATPEGKVVSAGSLPANTQVAMPFNSAFSRPQHGGNNRSGEHGDHHGGGTGNGGSNAQNSRSAGGLADSHVGGGRQGGGFHY